MHDTFLNQNLYDSIVKLCDEHAISKVHSLTLTVHTHSHVCEQSIKDHFKDHQNPLIDASSYITVQKKEIEPLTATIEQIDGE